MIDIKNIKSMKIVNPNSINVTSKSPIKVPDEMEDIKQESFKRRGISIHPDLKTQFLKW